MPRLDDQKSAAESATSRNQAEVEQAELYPLESEVVENNGAGDWNRTNDLRFTKPLLYQLSYAGAG
jgi:hypothetical protein